MFLFFVLFILQLISLIHYLNRVNRDLANFLLFLQEDDTTLAFSKKRVEKNFGNIIIDLDKIVKKLHHAGVEKVQQQYFISAIVEQVNVGLIAFTAEGRIDLVNQTATKLFGVNRNQHISNITVQYPDLLDVFKPTDALSPRLVKITKDGRLIHLAIKTTILRFGEEAIYLVSFDDIRSELEAQEIEAWRKLIRILRHEIMNSITPILTLTTAIRRSFVADGDVKPAESIKAENINDALECAKVIEERSNALISFVEKFKNLTTPPAINVKPFLVDVCFQKVGVLFSDEFEKHSIKFNTHVKPEKLMLSADQELIEQVLINLVKNSLEAITNGEGSINLNAKLGSNNAVIIQVIDNGTGIAPEYLENVFTPSFTTKKGGMGIGLSLSKQIMQLHQGTITIDSRSGYTCFELLLSNT